jgi:glutathione reductase (NADPH)
MADYDLIVLGTGSAGTKIAQRCRQEGWRVAIVEEREFGGTCALRGCEPKKTLWVVAEAADRARRLGSSAGLSGSSGLGVDWPALMDFKRSFTDPVPEAREEAFAEAGIEALRGSARFVRPDAIAVDGQTLTARHIVIATGAKPAPLPIPGLEYLTTSDEFLELDSLPDRLLMLGGGYISFEFAHIAARAGSEVTVLHKGKTPLKGFDADLVARLVEHSRRCGIRVELGEEVKRIERAADGQIAVKTGSGRRFEAPVAVHGLGRVPNIDDLDLAAGEVETEKGKLKLDRHLRSTSNQRVFAAGDSAAAGPPLTPVSTHDADCVSRNLIESCRHAPDYDGAASVVFTIPPLAKTGMTEAEARENERAVDVHFGDMSDYQSVRRQGHAQAGTAFKILLDRKNGCIIGAHLYAPDAHEVINLFALSVRLKLSARELGALLSAYPSEASNIGSMLG